MKNNLEKKNHIVRKINYIFALWAGDTDTPIATTAFQNENWILLLRNPLLDLWRPLEFETSIETNNFRSQFVWEVARCAISAEVANAAVFAYGQHPMKNRRQSQL